MYIEKERLTVAYNEFGKVLADYKLPSWEDLPEIELYMDQVISLIKKYLEIFYEVTGEEKFITPSMINNYVKLGIIPAPEKKRYGKKHLAYLLIVCTLKQTLDMSTIQKIISVGIDEEDVIKAYNSFVHNQHKAYGYVIDKVRTVADPILNFEGDNPDRINDLVMQVSASANIFKMLTERLTGMASEK